MRTVCVFVGAVVLLAAGWGAAPGAAQDGTRHVIYLHGRIIQEQQSPRPQHPEHGFYELDQILSAVRTRGFLVSGEIRPKSALPAEWADRTAAEVRRLIGQGVPADRITVVGASMGGGIAVLTASRLQNPSVRFAVLGVCLSANVKGLLSQQGKGPVGRVLSIRESSDETTEPCDPWASGEGESDLVVREMVLHTGLRHGFLYRPLPEWVGPVIEWAMTDRTQ